MLRDKAYDAVVFDLLTALLNSWKLWNEVAGSEVAGRRWRDVYLRLTYQCGAYRPYGDLVHEAAAEAKVPQDKANALLSSFDRLEPWDDVGEVVGGLSRRVRLGVATNCSNHLAGIAARRVGAPFAAVVTAEAAGYYKPRPEPYLRVLEALGTAPKRTLFVAGSAADVPGASGVGMPVFWHNRLGLPAAPGGKRPVAVSDTLKPLLKMV